MLKKVALVVALAIVSVGPAAADQHPKFIVGDAQIGYMQTVQPPEIRCVGGQPTGLPFPMCSEGTKRIIGKKEVQIWGPGVMSDSVRAMLDGPITFVVNCTLDANYRGPCWGTFEWDVPNVGKWAGFWVAPVMDLITYESQMSMVGFGVSGQLHGKQMKFDGGSAPWDWYISGSVRIH